MTRMILLIILILILAIGAAVQAAGQADIYLPVVYKDYTTPTPPAAQSCTVYFGEPGPDACPWRLCTIGKPDCPTPAPTIEPEHIPLPR
jgi:hypothetical protein